MSLVCFASAKGSPGVTLTALGVAAAWPTPDGLRKVLVEADPSGGVLAVRYQLGRQPGLITLAASGRHGGTARGDLWAHAQQLPGGLPVIVAHERADRTRQVLESAGAQLASWLCALPEIVAVADCGRVSPEPAAGVMCGEADLVLLVARPDGEHIHPAAAMADALASAGRRVAWVLIGDQPHSAQAVERVTGHPVARVLPHDERGARALTAGRVPRFGRSPLVTEIAGLASDLAHIVHAPQPANTTALVEARPLRSLAAAAALAAGGAR